MQNNTKQYYALFLISAAALMLEISLIRAFSIAQFYHFAFMVVSIALFGIVASGTFLFVKKPKNPLFWSSTLFSITTITGFFIVNNLQFDPYKAVLDFSHTLVLAAYYISLGLPFFFFGIIVAFIFLKRQKHSGIVYFYNLSGSAVGTILSIPLLALLNVRIILIISLLGLISSMLFIKKTHLRRRCVFLPKCVFLLILLAINLFLFYADMDINISDYKELNQALNFPNSRLIDIRYNHYSRVDVAESSFARYAPGLSPVYDKNLPDQVGIFVDGSNMNAITKHQDLEFLRHLPSSIPYSIMKNPEVLILNSGAGLDVLAALKYNLSVTAVESNPLIIEILRDEYKNFSGDIYNRAEVAIGEGRSFVKKDKKYDVIVLSLAGNVISGSGLTSLSENYLLTAEAFNDYNNALTEEGVLVITRWLFNPPKESLRLFSLALEIDPEAKRTAMLRSWSTITLLLFKKDLDINTVNEIRLFSRRNDFDIVYLPESFSFIPNRHSKFDEPVYYNTIQQLLNDSNTFYSSYIFDVSPVSDDKPFYFNFFRLSELGRLKKLLGQRWNPFLDPGFLLLLILIQTLILSFLFIFFPLFFRKKMNRMKVEKKPLFYFFLIGIAFMFVEIVLMQKFVLFLGHIIYSTTSIIFSMLLFSSIGSLKSQKYNGNIKKLIFVLFLLIIIYLFLSKAFIDSFISLSLTAKIILAVIFVAPLSFVMGFMFPLGIKRIDNKLVPWAWSVNGSASVLSPVLAVFLALSFGYNLVFILSGLFYLVSHFFIEN